MLISLKCITWKRKQSKLLYECGVLGPMEDVVKGVVEANAKTFKLEKQSVMVTEEVAVRLCVFKNE